jgi:hypothetical protein
MILRSLLILFFVESIQQVCTKPLELKTEGPLFNLCLQFENRLKWISNFQTNR